MNKAAPWVKLGLWACALLPLPAAAVDYLYLQGQIPKADKAITAYGTDLFGDKINLFDGSLHIEHTDLALRGNFDLPVELARKVSPGKSERNTALNRQLGDWAWALPRIGGTYTAATGWKVYDSANVKRCSQFGPPPDEPYGRTPVGGMLPSQSFWHGVHIDVPGHGMQEVLTRATDYVLKPQGTLEYRLVTKANWQIRCLDTIKNGPGEGFVAISPQGVRYDFDWMVTRASEPLRAGGGTVLRQDVHLYATKVTDRYGNTVDYTFDNANPGQLLKISSNDLRQINIGYAGGKAQWASDGTRTVTYGYGTSGELATVTRPDGQKWRFNLLPMALSNLGIISTGLNCDDGSSQVRPEVPVGTMQHPSGAWVEFQTRFVVLAKTGAPGDCYPVDGTLRMTYPPYSVNLAVTRKTIRDLGDVGSPAVPLLPRLVWDFELSDPTNRAYTDTADFRQMQVTEPDLSVTRHRFGNTWHKNETQLLSVEKGWTPTSTLQSTFYRYRQPAANHAYRPQFGWGHNDDTGDWIGSRNLPLDEVTITQQGTSFKWQVQQDPSGFDEFAQVRRVTKTGPGGSRFEETQYRAPTGRWVLGQVEVLTVAGQEARRDAYDDKASLTSRTEFGVLKFSRTYTDQVNGFGLLRTQSDGAGNTTLFENYHRGIAQKVTYANGVVEAAEVNNLGAITRFTSASGNVNGIYVPGETTQFGYDADGRLSLITPPAGFLPTSLSFAPTTGAAFGIPAGHWKQVITKGNARTEVYFDVLWRPLMSRVHDTQAVASTQKVVVKGYSSTGGLAFESYPQRDITSFATRSPGKRTWHDALGRVTRTEADSELGILVTTDAYLDGFKTLHTNARGKPTLQTLWALDKPTESQVKRIDASHGVVVHLARDVFGKATSISRGGVTRSYVYDAGQRLCKTVEPESGATVQHYDAAGNVAWRAPGQALPDPSNCDTLVVPPVGKISFAYDAVNQLRQTSYGDGSPGIVRDYWPDGSLLTVSSGDATWSYRYNPLQALTEETLNLGGVQYKFQRNYNASGDLESLVYPGWGGTTIQYAPNALGEPTMVSGVASGVAWYPNGAVAGYTLNNGITHTLLQNLRGLPSLLGDAGVMQDQYTYDANGNVASIGDAQNNNYHRAMGYDDLDRLTSANAFNTSGAAVAWGTASYTYDAADNLLTANVGNRQVTLNYNDGTNRVTSLTQNGSALPLTYDAYGNVRFKGSAAYVFDQGNRLRSSSPGGTYSYDGLGRRTRFISTDGSTRLHMYSQAGQLLMSTSSGGPRPAGGTLYFYLGAKQIAEWDSVRGTQYVHTDALGSPVARTNSAGVLLGPAGNAHSRYEPYGYVATGPKPGPASGLIGFTGHVQDAETDLVYMQQRYYDPVAGRFLSVDPVTTDAKTGDHFNRYVYAENNPYKFKDPDGRAPQLIEESKYAGRPMVGMGQTNADGGPVRLGTRAERIEALQVSREARGLQGPPGPAVDKATGQTIGRVAVDSKGNAMIEPAGGNTVPAGKSGVSTHTLYPNGSNYQRLDPKGHGNNPTPHGHGHLPGPGTGKAGQGKSIDPQGNVVPPNSPAAHWPIKEK